MHSRKPTEECGMLKISVVNGPPQRRLVVEGTLVEPWVAELLSEYTKAKEHVDGVRAAKYTVDGGARGMREVFRSASWPPRLWA